jgi:spore coat protein U-like protein
MGIYRYMLHCLIAGVVVALTFSVYADAGCTVNTTSIHFGSYDVFSPAATTSTGTITLSCTPKADITIDIGASSNSGSFSPRRMRHTSLGDTIDYNLYTSANRIQIWGDGTLGTAHPSFSDVKNKNTPPIIIYGIIAPQQNVSTGSYSDQLVVTITY